MIFATFAVIGAIAFGWLSLTASQSLVVENGIVPALVVEPGVAELGSSRQNQTLAGQYRLVNRLPFAVDVIQVAKSCSCADADVETKHLKPGQETNLNVAWKTGLKRGKVTDRVTVMAKTVEGQPQTIFAELILKADVIPDVKLDPETLSFPQGQSGTATITVLGNELAAVKVVQAYGNVNGLKSIARPGTNIVDVTYTPSEIPADAKELLVLIETTSTVEKWIRVPIRFTPSESK